MRFTFARRAGKRWVTRGTVVRKGKKGANRVRFAAKAGKKRLPTGRYRVTARPSVDGVRGAGKRVRLRIVRR